MIEKKFKSFNDEIIGIINSALTGYTSTEKIVQLTDIFLKNVADLNIGKSSESNLLRLFDSLYDKTAFFIYCFHYPHHVEITLLIANYSNYLTEIIIRNPEFLHQVFQEEYQKSKIDVQTEINLNKQIGFYKSFNSKVNYLKTFKRRELLKIGVNDILGNCDLLSTTFELSKLANIVISALFKLCKETVENELGIDLQECRYSVCALGKLGGMELNYSSDIDLLIFYENNIPDIIEGKIDYYSYIIKIIQLFIKTATTISEKGFLYRIDFRLRPDGKNAPLCRPISEYLRYYETRGEEWERQMLLKLNFVTGDKKLFNQFASYLAPYIYPKSFSFSIFSNIKKLKTQIEQQNYDKLNVKLFSGGIRDIEFSIQGLQLLNGGKIAEVRGGNSLKVIAALKKNQLLISSEAEVFTDSYLFYRKIEHFLQLMNDRQTHEIPLNDTELLNKLACFTGFSSIESFLQYTCETRSKVKQIFDSILGSNEKSGPAFHEIFTNHSKAEKNMKFLKYGSGIISEKNFDSRTILLFDSFFPLFQTELINSHFPDRLLENFVKIIQSVPFPSIWYREFADKKFLHSFLQICTYSQKSINLILTNKLRGEIYLSRMVFSKKILESFVNLKPEDLVFIISIQFSLKLIYQQQVSEILCNYFSKLIDNIAKQVFSKSAIFIAGAGSFGNYEMSFASDIDLIFCVKKITPKIQIEVTQFLDIFNKAILPFKFDLRLRPEGHKGALIWDLKTFEVYLQKRIRIWEIQSLHKSRFVFGNKTLFGKFQKQLCDYLIKLNKHFVASEIIDMRNLINKQSLASLGGFWNIKKDTGGLNDIEFILHYFLLTKPILYKNTMGKPNKLVFSKLLKEMPDNRIKNLQVNYSKLKSFGLANQSIFDLNKYHLSKSEESLKLIAAFYEKRDHEQIKNMISEALKYNSKLFVEILNVSRHATE